MSLTFLRCTDSLLTLDLPSHLSFLCLPDSLSVSQTLLAVRLPQSYIQGTSPTWGGVFRVQHLCLGAGTHSSLLLGPLSCGQASLITSVYSWTHTQPAGLQEDMDTGVKALSHSRHFEAFKFQTDLNLGLQSPENIDKPVFSTQKQYYRTSHYVSYTHTGVGSSTVIYFSLFRPRGWCTRTRHLAWDTSVPAVTS